MAPMASVHPFPVWAATRDASTLDRPDVRATKRIHVANADGESCCARQVLDENAAWPLAEVPSHLRCRRPACARRWNAA